MLDNPFKQSFRKFRRKRVKGLTVICLLYVLYGPPMLKKVDYGDGILHSTFAAGWLSIARRSSNKATLRQYLEQHCSHLQQPYDTLLDPLLEHWNATGFGLDALEHTSGERVYIYNDRISMSESTGWARTIPTFVSYLRHIHNLAHLPNMVLPLNPADEPLAAIKDGEQPRPLLAFCKTPQFSDVLIPNTAEGDSAEISKFGLKFGVLAYVLTYTAGDVYSRPNRARGDRLRILSGPHDTRKAAIVWRGTTGGFGGLKKGRHIVLELGLKRPDLIDSGVSDWNVDHYGPDRGKLKPYMSMRDQVTRYKYQAWLPGNCASIRLALQLAADAAVFKVEHEDTEWYYPMLQPYVHYIPIIANETFTNLLDQLHWAETHPGAVRAIVTKANMFARSYLSALGRDCYTMQLLERYAALTIEELAQPRNVVSPPW